jgi:hypothetical protein
MKTVGRQLLRPNGNDLFLAGPLILGPRSAPGLFKHLYKQSASDTIKYELDGKGSQNDAGKSRQNIGAGSLQHPVQDVREDHPEVR